MLSEKERFKLRSRAHLFSGVSSNNILTDEYFAIDRETKQKVIVKGPFIKRHGVENVIQITNIKKILELPYIGVKEVFLMPDLFRDSATIRQDCREDKLHAFLIFDDVCFCREFGNDIPIMKSKIFPSINVVDPKKFAKLKKDQVKCQYAIPSLVVKNTNAMYMYILIMIFRHALGIPNPILENCLYNIDAHVIYTVGEERMWKRELKSKLWDNLKESELEIVYDFIDNNWENIETLIKRLYRKIRENKKRIKLILGDNYDLFYKNVRKLSKKEFLLERACSP